MNVMISTGKPNTNEKKNVLLQLKQNQSINQSMNTFHIDCWIAAHCIEIIGDVTEKSLSDYFESKYLNSN